jgi:hypothetical protein
MKARNTPSVRPAGSAGAARKRTAATLTALRRVGAPRRSADNRLGYRDRHTTTGRPVLERGAGQAQAFARGWFARDRPEPPACPLDACRRRIAARRPARKTRDPASARPTISASACSAEPSTRAAQLSRVISVADDPRELGDRIRAPSSLTARRLGAGRPHDSHRPCARAGPGAWARARSRDAAGQRARPRRPIRRACRGRSVTHERAEALGLRHRAAHHD